MSEVRFELIRKDAIMSHIEVEAERWGEEYDAWQILGDIEDFPTIDAVEVVRCRDCKHKDDENGFCKGRGWPMQLAPDDGFCDKGKRRDE